MTTGLTIADYAWAAGFIDGEGSIGISKRRRPRSEHREAHPQFWALITCPQVDPRPLLALKGMFGGHLYHRRRTSESHADIYDWHLSGPSVVPMLTALRPHFRLKGEQADILIDFQKRMNESSRGHITASILEYRQGARDRLRALNRNGVSKPLEASA